MIQLEKWIVVQPSYIQQITRDPNWSLLMHVYVHIYDVDVYVHVCEYVYDLKMYDV